jgi:ATP-dependent Clp protease ATP-binding subunit ClpX
LDYIVQKAVEFKLGARGLRSICEVIMTDAMFEFDGESSGTELVINEKNLFTLKVPSPPPDFV